MRNKALSLTLLREIVKNQGPLGAIALSRQVDASQATIGRCLADLEAGGWVRRMGNKGRIATEKGLQLLAKDEQATQKSKIANELANLSSGASKGQLLDTMGVRSLLEPHMAGIAAARATKVDIQQLENYAYAHRMRLSQGQAANEEDLGFHMTIARMAQNQALTKILELLLTDNDAYIAFSHAGDTKRDAQVEAHFQIMEAIRAGNSGKAQNAMHAHLQQVAEDVRKCYPDQKEDAPHAVPA